MRPLSTGAHPLQPGRPLVYAHRGGAALRPENTIEAFDHGLSFGADGLEFDVHLSKDGVVVVHHDATLERTTSGHGRVADHTAEELARLDAGYWFTAETPAAASGVTADAGEAFSYRGRDVRIPTLRDLLRRYPDTGLLVELKANDPELARRTIDEIRAARAVERTALGSFYRDVLHAARSYEPRLRTGAAREETRWALYRSWVGWQPRRRPPYREFQVPERSGATTIVTPRFVNHAHRAGLTVKVWTVDDPADMRRLISWGVDALISDRPDLAMDVVRGT